METKLTARKNKTNQQINWVNKPIFSIQDLKKNNPDININTLKHKLSTAIVLDKQVVIVGFLGNGKGRPENIYAKLPLTQNIFDELNKNNIVPMDGIDKYVHVVNINNNKSL